MSSAEQLPMYAVLITGIPGAGKSTTSRALAARYPFAAHVEGDVLSFEFVISGLAEPFGSKAKQAEWRRQMDLRRKNMCLLADSFADAGFVPILDDVATDPEEVASHLRLLKTRPLHLIVLAPSLEVAAVRDAARKDSVLDVWLHLDAELRTKLVDHGHWIDTSELTVDETVDRILGAIADGSSLYAE